MATPTTDTQAQAPMQAGLPLPPTPTHGHGPMRLVIDTEGRYRIVGKESWLSLKDIGPHRAQDAL